MPIYEQTYRQYEGRIRGRFRWAIVVEQELRVLVKARPFLILMLLALLHCILRLLQVVAYDVIMQDPNNPMRAVLQHLQAVVVNERMFFDFIRLQTPIVFITCLYAGSGMICNDFRNNLMEVYFSKPLRWYDYAAGKIMSLTLIGLMLTAVPGVFLVFLHNMLLPGEGFEMLRETYWWPVSIMGFSLVVVLPCALGVLASSALMGGQNFAAVAVFMVVIANSAMGGLLAGLLQQRNYLLLSFPMAVNRVGQRLFHDHRLLFESHWAWSFSFVAGVCLLAAWIVFRKARRAEVAA